MIHAPKPKDMPVLNIPQFPSIGIYADGDKPSISDTASFKTVTNYKPDDISQWDMSSRLYDLLHYPVSAHVTYNSSRCFTAVVRPCNYDIDDHSYHFHHLEPRSRVIPLISHGEILNVNMALTLHVTHIMFEPEAFNSYGDLFHIIASSHLHILKGISEYMGFDCYAEVKVIIPSQEFHHNLAMDSYLLHFYSPVNDFWHTHPHDIRPDHFKSYMKSYTHDYSLRYVIMAITGLGAMREDDMVALSLSINSDDKLQKIITGANFETF